MKKEILPSIQEQQKLFDIYSQNLALETMSHAKLFISQFPTHGFGWKILGAALHDLGRINEAIEVMKKAIQFLPNDVEVFYNFGLILKDKGDLLTAEENYLKALLIDEHYADAYNNLGIIYQQKKNFKAARMYFDRALECDSNHGDAYINLGNLLADQDKLLDAEQAYFKAFKLIPDNKYAIGMKYLMRRSVCQWTNYAIDNEELLTCFKTSQMNVMSPFMLLAVENFNCKFLKDAGRLFADFTYKFQLNSRELSTTIVNFHHKLRIGYLSGDFHSHATVYLMAGVLENRNKTEFDVYLYSYGVEQNNDSRSRITNACELFHDVRNLSDEDIAQQILNDEIDVLVDLKGFTQEARLGIQAFRPAPVIVSWLGYPGTLGHERLADYIIGDPTVTPPERAEYYSETLALMPHCYQPNDNKRPIGVAPTRTEVGLPENTFVFCTFNQAYKITPDMFDIWCRLLGAVPNSVLWLLEPNTAAQENLCREIELRGIESSRLIFAPKMEQTAHLGRLQLADLAVDTFPYTSHTTASDALWAGVPLITKMGETFASRVAASILNTMDLSELVTTNDEDYFNVALNLAQNSEKLTAIKQKIVEQKQISPLFDTQKFARDLERLYQTIWEQELRGERKAIVLTDEPQKEITTMNETLEETLRVERLTEIVDIGANPIDGDPPYKPMLSKALCNITGFEPQELALAELLKKKSKFERYLPYAVGDGNVHTLNICRASGMTSLFEPDATTLELFDILKPLAEVTQRIEIHTRKLDEIIEIEKLDFLKIDIQGGELLVFKNGVNKLANAVAIQVEVSFVTLYKNQPTMGEIDIELRRQGFIPHCFAAVKKWAISPCVVNNNPHEPLNQLLEADIVYVRDFSKPEFMTDEQLKHLAMIVHYCYGSFDLALRCIMLLEQRNALPSGSQQTYLDSLGRKA